MYKASIIIPVYNNLIHLKYTLNTLTKQTVEKNKFEVIVCDDGSSIDILNGIQEFKSKLNIVYKFQKDLGFRAAAARNMGIKSSKGEICIFLDSGILAASSFIEEHLKSHGNSSKKAVIGYIYGFDNLNLFQKELKDNIDLNDIDKTCKILQEKGIFDMREEVYNDIGDNLALWPAPWCYFWSGNISVKKSVLMEVGMFDEYHITWGGEDVDLGITLFNLGIEFTLNRNALTVDYPHEKVHSMAKDFDDFVKKLIEKRQYLLKKYKMKEIEIWIDLLDTKKLNRYLINNEKKEKL